jgi:hypothetical protein
MVTDVQPPVSPAEGPEWIESQDAGPDGHAILLSAGK